jgi:hypothetical protein
MAEWQIGYAADCKSVYLGSTPGSASKYSYLYQLVFIQVPPVARVVKLVDTRDLKSLVRKDVPVQVRPRAPFVFMSLKANFRCLTFYFIYKILYSYISDNALSLLLSRAPSVCFFIQLPNCAIFIFSTATKSMC